MLAESHRGSIATNGRTEEEMRNHAMNHIIYALAPALLVSCLFAFNDANAQSAAAPASAGLTSGQQAPPPLVIDSFKAGPYSTPPLATTVDAKAEATQFGDKQELLGGSRHAYVATHNADKQPVSVQVLTTKPALIVNAGYHVYPALELSYKVPAASANFMARYDRFLIDFDGLDHGLDLIIAVYDNQSSSRPYIEEVCKFTPFDGPFTLSFPFSRFGKADVKHATTILFKFQPTSWGVDYAITRLTSAQGDPGGRHIVTCLK
ncbi:MAG TPA: hypothetical protein VF219_04965 [Vicinamibacterales bacterium]